MTTFEQISKQPLHKQLTIIGQLLMTVGTMMVSAGSIIKLGTEGELPASNTSFNFDNANRNGAERFIRRFDQNY